MIHVLEKAVETASLGEPAPLYNWLTSVESIIERIYDVIPDAFETNISMVVDTTCTHIAQPLHIPASCVARTVAIARKMYP